MSLYNMLMGINPACILIMPMLGRKQNEYPRFRDCFVSENETILILTRVGGPNRDSGFGEGDLYKDSNFIRTWDLEEDNTYGIYEFTPPDQWRSDFCHILNNEMNDVSEEYVELVKEFYPRLAESGKIDEMFGRKRPISSKKRRK